MHGTFGVDLDLVMQIESSESADKLLEESSMHAEKKTPVGGAGRA